MEHTSAPDSAWKKLTVRTVGMSVSCDLETLHLSPTTSFEITILQLDLGVGRNFEWAFIVGGCPSPYITSRFPGAL